LGGQRGQLNTPENRQLCVELIDEAHASGARISKACEVMVIGKRTYERWKANPDGFDKRNGPLTTPNNKLSEKEEQAIVAVCCLAHYADLPPSQIVPLLADSGEYLASESTFYRILKKNKMQNHRSNTKPRKSNKPKPLIADKPNKIWSWDVTYLPANVKGMFFYLYLIMDIYSRKIVGWEVFEKESMEYSSELIEASCLFEGVTKDSLTLHSDNGAIMKGITMLAKLQELGVAASFSRPSVSNDNPYSESLFGTMKYCPQYPQKPFESIDAAREWVKSFVDGYNCQHLHSSINFVTPEDRHNGFDGNILLNRRRIYEKARMKHPERWSGKTRNWDPVQEVLLNPLKEKEKDSIMENTDAK
jgi:putative transposase